MAAFAAGSAAVPWVIALRPDPPQYADINLMEDLDTLNLPPASDAGDGVLDV